jgi:hypothetical protein
LLFLPLEEKNATPRSRIKKNKKDEDQVKEGKRGDAGLQTATTYYGF